MRLFLEIVAGIIVFSVLPSFVCIFLANRKGYPPDKASRMGCLLGWIAVILYLLKPDL